jgi:hypothetical protein
VRPSLRKPLGKRWTRYWSVQDLVAVRSVKALRAAGCPLPTVRKVKKKVEEWGSEMASTSLYWDGHDVIELGATGTLKSLIVKPNQQMLHVISLPLKAWRSDADQQATAIDASTLNRRPVRVTVRAKVG